MSELIIVGDRVLLEPLDQEKRTEGGLVLPITVTDRDVVRYGRVVKVGPGYLLPNPEYSESRPWATRDEAVRYLPLQVAPGDFADFLRKKAIELKYQNRTYVIVPHGAILALVRPSADDLLENIQGLLEQ